MEQPAMITVDNPAFEPGHPESVRKVVVQRAKHEAPLDRLWRDGRITQREFQAGDKLRSDAYLSAVEPTTGSINWDHAGGGGRSARVPVVFEADTIMAARQRFRAVTRAITGSVWSVLVSGVVRENGMEEIGKAVFARSHRRDAEVAGHAGLRIALGSLADYYGM